MKFLELESKGKKKLGLIQYKAKVKFHLTLLIFSAESKLLLKELSSSVLPFDKFIAATKIFHNFSISLGELKNLALLLSA